jgi:hypothetical protein
MGLQDSQIVVHGLPIRPAFARRQPSKKSLRSKLGALSGICCTSMPACDAAFAPDHKTSATRPSTTQLQSEFVCLTYHTP